jgi:hypothetical protein
VNIRLSLRVVISGRHRVRTFVSSRRRWHFGSFCTGRRILARFIDKRRARISFDDKNAKDHTLLITACGFAKTAPLNGKGRDAWLCQPKAK